VLSEHPDFGSVDVPGEERGIHLGQVVYQLFGEVGFGVGGAPRPRERGADLVGRVAHRVVGTVDGGVVERGSRSTSPDGGRESASGSSRPSTPAASRWLLIGQPRTLIKA
jgi:hypothetical protein